MTKRLILPFSIIHIIILAGIYEKLFFNQVNIKEKEIPTLVLDEEDINHVSRQHQSEQQQSNEPNDHLLLNVPFYIYEDEFLNDENILNFTDMYKYAAKEYKEYNSIPKLKEGDKKVTFSQYVKYMKDFKHFGDGHFIRSALEHPMRVFDPQDAKIFVIPSLITREIATSWYSDNDDTRKIAKENLNRMNKKLEESPWFQRNNGADHIAPVAFFRAEVLVKRFFPLLTRCNIVQFFQSPDNDQNIIDSKYSQNRTMFKIFYVGNPCQPYTPFEQKTQDLAFIGSLTRTKRSGRLADRRNMCNWLTETNYTYEVCGVGNKCPNLSQALIGFHPRGDSISAGRLFDMLLGGTVPVFTLEGQYHTLPEWYDWEKMSYFADVQNKDKFLEDVDRILSNRTDLMVKTKNVLENNDLFNWQTLVPFDIYMYHLQVKLFPETRVSSSKYNALILPLMEE